MKTTRTAQGIKMLKAMQQMVIGNLFGATGSERERLEGELEGIEAKLAELQKR